jgi:glycosyltransferase involved in cell wall biosynthesis
VPKFSFVIPSYNREVNLRLCLTALKAQRGAEPFEVVVADDGSTDGTQALVREFGYKLAWQPHQGFRAAAARNLGTLLATGDWFWFIDSDVLLHPGAVFEAQELIKRFPNALILGRYDWMGPMHVTPEDIRTRFSSFSAGLLPKKTIAGDPGRVGPDPRCPEKHPTPEETPLTGYRNAAFSGNIIVPRVIFAQLGGYDASIVGHGGEDMEFGTRAQFAGVQAVFSSRIVGYHVCHERDQARNVAEVKVNLAYIWKKLDLERILGIDMSFLERIQ